MSTCMLPVDLCKVVPPQATDRALEVRAQLVHLRTRPPGESLSSDLLASWTPRISDSRSSAKKMSKVMSRLCLPHARRQAPASMLSTSANARASTRFSARRWRRETSISRRRCCESLTKINIWSWHLLHGISSPCLEPDQHSGLTACRNSLRDWTRCCLSRSGMSLWIHFPVA